MDNDNNKLSNIDKTNNFITTDGKCKVRIRSHDKSQTNNNKDRNGDANLVESALDKRLQHIEKTAINELILQRHDGLE